MVSLLPGLSRSSSQLSTTAVVHDPPVPGARMTPAPGYQRWSYWKRKVLLDKQTPGLPHGEQPKMGLSWISPTAPPAPRLAPTARPGCAVGPGGGGGTVPTCQGCSVLVRAAQGCALSSSLVSAEGSTGDPLNLELRQ